MKKFFGGLFIFAGIGSFIKVFAISATNATTNQNLGAKVFFGIGFLGLGIYLFSSGNSKDGDDTRNLPNKEEKDLKNN